MLYNEKGFEFFEVHVLGSVCIVQASTVVQKYENTHENHNNVNNLKIDSQQCIYTDYR